MKESVIEREKALPSTGLLPSECKSQGWVRQKPGAQHLNCVSHIGGGLAKNLNVPWKVLGEGTATGFILPRRRPELIQACPAMVTVGMWEINWQMEILLSLLASKKKKGTGFKVLPSIRHTYIPLPGARQIVEFYSFNS